MREAGAKTKGDGGVTVRIATRLADLPLVSKTRAGQLRRLDLHTVGDLLRHLPSRYEKLSPEGAIAELQPDSQSIARGTVMACRAVEGRGRRGRFEATLKDDSGSLAAVWFAMPYLRNRIHAGQELRLTGKVKRYEHYLQMVNPRWELLNDPDAEQASEDVEGGEAGAQGVDVLFEPVYPITKGLGQAAMRRLMERVMAAAAGAVVDPLPARLIEGHHLPTLEAAYRWVHAPAEEDEYLQGLRRLKYNELLLLQLGLALRRAHVEHHLHAHPLRHTSAIDRHIRERFPFTLTAEQDRVVAEIAADLTRPRPMNRLLQGDVGAGKTVVAAYALLMAAADRRQSVLLAPTELLAEQHFASLSGVLERSNVRTELLTGNTPDRPAVLERIATGAAEVVIGTHAVLSEGVRFKDLAVAVVDEQHRFGVKQRAALREAVGSREGQDAGASARTLTPHMLVMTATPIPRTLALTVFGDLDTSTLKGLPPGRTPIESRVVSTDQRDAVYGYFAKRVAKGEQAYVVVPAVEETAATESSSLLVGVNAHAKRLSERYFAGQKVAVVHGQLKSETRRRVMEKFRCGEVNVLVATTVIEVGVDVANATLMAIEQADRFGLAQLHQLRGRVGRGTGKSLCVFLGDPRTEDGQKRLDAVAATTDGFKIAELDFDIRGTGELLGTRQSGQLPLRVASLPEDMDLLKLAKRDADALVAADPALDLAEHAGLRRVLVGQFGAMLGLADVG